MAPRANVKKKAIMLAAGALAAGALATTTAASFLASCATTPANAVIQTFEQPKNMDVVCLNVIAPDGGPIIPAIPQPQAACAQVPPNVVGASLPFHLYALVTQTTRGEVAVVDLTAGAIVDEDPNTPGINFLPVGRLPSDIAATPDGTMVFVGSADPDSPAIFALPSTIMLGNSQAFDGGTTSPNFNTIPIPQLTTWPVCALPQTPGAIRVLPNGFLPPLPGGGAPPSSSAGYVIVAVLPGDTANSAKVVTIDPAPLVRGAQAYVDAGGIPEDAGIDSPGKLTPCSLLEGEYPLTLGPGPASPPTAAGPPWDDGVPYVDGGLDADVPTSAVACVTAPDAGVGGMIPTGGKPGGGASVLDTSGSVPLLYVADTTFPLIHVIDLSNPVAPREMVPLQATSIADPTRIVSIGPIAVSPTTRNFQRFLYAVDQSEGSIMVYEVTDPISSPKVPLTRPNPEIDPFQPPDRILFSAPVASVAFVQHDWPLTATYPLVPTNPPSLTANALTAAETGLLCNPNPNVNAPTPTPGVPVEQGPFIDDGAYYRNANTQLSLNLGPYRLRGIFAFATLTSGSVIAIDVDDWDAPCRRPDPLAPTDSLTLDQGVPDAGALASTAASLVEGPFSAIAPPQPDAGPGDTNPYHVPFAFDESLPPALAYTDSPVSLEWFFPVSAPHRGRSAFILRNDPVNGQHAPFLLSVPQLFSSGSPIATQGAQAIPNPSMVPTDTPFVDPSIIANPTEPDPLLRTPNVVLSDDAGTDAGNNPTLSQSLPLAPPGVRFAWEDPEVQINQDWTVTYEGPLPGFFDSSGNPLVVANVVAFNQLTVGGVTPNGAQPDYSAVWLTSPNTFCGKGVEDFSLGTQRADSENAALAQAGLPTIPNFDHQVADYIQLTDNIVPDTDQYWTVENSCWSQADPDAFNNPSNQGSSPANVANRAAAFFAFCSSVFGETLIPASPSPQRDFPIIAAYNDKLLVSRFGYNPDPTTGVTSTVRAPGASNWAVVGPDPGNSQFLAAMQCCFHSQIHFNVRSGGQWSAAGSTSGLLHHIVATGSDGHCAPSCDQRDVLLNGRAAPVPRVAATPATIMQSCSNNPIPSINRDSVLAMRNPMFSFLIWNGQDPTNNCAGVPPVRDMTWAFSTRGQYSPIALNLAGSSPGLSPQSMLFIDSLGQLAIIDGESQGLILIDLNSIAEAHPPYF